jgi:hypothetical protein
MEDIVETVPSMRMPRASWALTVPVLREAMRVERVAAALVVALLASTRATLTLVATEATAEERVF